jgi:hypothetical protein
MTTQPNDDVLIGARHLVPSALFAGIAVSFLGCCLAGYLASHHNPFGRVERFHLYLTPESLFYPTASQVRELARSELERDKIAVVIGGSSRLHGTGQPLAAVWTRRLQAELGDDFQVLNFALRAGNTCEFGELIAEMLLPEHSRLIFISDVNPGGWIHTRLDGDHFRYFYWDARSKEMLLPAPERDAALRAWGQFADALPAAAGKMAGQYSEIRQRTRLDHCFYFNDLWNWIGYARLFTLWTPQSHRPFTRPRRSFDDSDFGAPPPEKRFPGDHFARDMTLFHRHLAATPLVRDSQGEWREDSAHGNWSVYRRTLHLLFPEAIREHVVLVVPQHSRYHVNQLSPEEQEAYAALCTATARVTEAEHFAALSVGSNFQINDYADLCHYSSSGGVKLARQVAAKVRERAQALGYLP